MKIWIFSDTHRDISRRPWTPVAIPDADVAVVAGDIGHGLADSVSWLGLGHPSLHAGRVRTGKP